MVINMTNKMLRCKNDFNNRFKWMSFKVSHDL